MNSRRRTIATLGAALALTVAPAAQAAVDYSKNSATGDYAPAVTAPAQAATPASADDGFAWGDAALGAAGATAAFAVAFAAGRRLRVTGSGGARSSTAA
jgi:hypothetical protein